jgi:hypothetical protein
VDIPPFILIISLANATSLWLPHSWTLTRRPLESASGSGFFNMAVPISPANAIFACTSRTAVDCSTSRRLTLASVLASPLRVVEPLLSSAAKSTTICGVSTTDSVSTLSWLSARQLARSPGPALPSGASMCIHHSGSAAGAKTAISRESAKAFLA